MYQCVAACDVKAGVMDSIIDDPRVCQRCKTFNTRHGYFIAL
jgi:hypothetical protein